MSQTAKTFMKVCLHSSKVVQNSFRFDELFDKNLKILISQLYIFFLKMCFIQNLLGHTRYINIISTA